MATLFKLSATLIIMLTLAGCDKLANYAGAYFLKANLKEVCGQDDSKCVAAVEQQFDACHGNNEEYWAAYMAADPDKQDQHLARYSKGMYSCIVDKDGIPYFVYNPRT